MSPLNVGHRSWNVLLRAESVLPTIRVRQSYTASFAIPFLSETCYQPSPTSKATLAHRRCGRFVPGGVAFFVIEEIGHGSHH